MRRPFPTTSTGLGRPPGSPSPACCLVGRPGPKPPPGRPIPRPVTPRRPR